LHALQLLAAHIKLLLDAPEHLWRFIEGKKFLVASWLFQLSSVVHQALLNSIEEENDWTDCGIDTVVSFQSFSSNPFAKSISPLAAVPPNRKTMGRCKTI
jgi:hypothetical protein